MSDINNYQYTRIPFLVLQYINKDITVPKELIYDDTTEKIYVRSLDGTEDIEIGKSYLEEIISIEIELIKNSVSEDGNTFEKIVNIYNQLLLWKDTIMNSPNNDIVSDLSDIIDKFRGLEESDPTLLNLIKSKVDKVLGKGLSTNDFTNELLLKLNSIEAESNNYTHPEEIVCSYKAPVTSVNDRIGDVVITKEELGFENVQEGAIKYSHPSTKQCTFTGISSVNGKTGVITVDKALIGLSEVKNNDVADVPTDDIKYCIDKYITPYSGNVMLSKAINQMYPNLKRNQLHDILLNEYVIGLLYKLNIKTIPDNAKVAVTGDKFSSTNKINNVESGRYRVRVYKDLNSTYKHIDVLNSNVDITMELPKSNLYFKGINKFDKSNTAVSSYLPVSEVDFVVPVLNVIVQKGAAKTYGYISSDIYGDIAYSLKGLLYSYDKSDIRVFTSYHSSQKIFIRKPDSNSLTVAGTNYNGELGVGNYTAEIRETTAGSSKYREIKDILCGYSVTYILYNDGSIDGSGDNRWGQLLTGGIDNPEKVNWFRPLPLTNVNSIHGDGITNFAILKDGTVMGWGLNYCGELGQGRITDIKTTAVTIPITDVKDIKVSKNCVYFIKNNNDIYVTGDNEYNKLTSSPNDEILTPTKFSLTMNTVKELVPYDHGMFYLMKDGTVKVSGSNSNATAGVPEEYPIGIKTVPISNVKSIHVFNFKTLFLLNDGTVKGCGVTHYDDGIIPYTAGRNIVTIFNEVPVVEVVPTFNGDGVFFILQE